DVQVAAEAADRIGHRRRDVGGGLTMPLPRVFGAAVVGAEARAGEVAAARIPVLLQEVGAQPIDQVAEGSQLLARLKPVVLPTARREEPDVGSEHRVLRMTDRTVTEKGVDAAADRNETVSARPRAPVCAR